MTQDINQHLKKIQGSITTTGPQPQPAPAAPKPQEPPRPSIKPFKLSMTTDKMEGPVSFVYNESGTLQSIEFPKMEGHQIKWITDRCPCTVDDIPQFMSKVPHAIFTQTDSQITFEMFWNKYNDKVRSSRKKATALWNNLPEVDQVAAYAYIPKYERHRGTADKKYATTYLSDMLWRN